MSKRKNRSSAPNIPQETLERARQQVSAEPEDTDSKTLEVDLDNQDDPVESEIIMAPPPPPVVRTTPRNSTRRRAEARIERGERGKGEGMTAQVIKERLANPTRVVTEAQLRQEYGYVIKDLRWMGILALGLIAFMVVVAQFLQ